MNTRLISIFSRGLLAGLLLMTGCKTFEMEEPAPLTEPAAVQLPDQPADPGACNNGYWPVLEGATWTYSVTETSLGDPDVTYMEYWTLRGIEVFSDKTQFFVDVFNPEDGTRGYNESYSCDSTGIYNNGLEMINSYGRAVMVLPSGDSLRRGFSWDRSDGTAFSITDLQDKNTAFGTRSVVTFGTNDPYLAGMYTFEYAEGIGMIDYFFGSDTSSVHKQLVDYSLNGNANEPIAAPTQAPQIAAPVNTGEARIRYILADIQLGGGYEYYRSTGDADALEAVRRWNMGIRVANIAFFERKTIGDLGWQIVYAGSNSPVNGMDIQLTAPPSPTPVPSLPPVIDRVELRYDRSSGTLIIYQDIYFHDANGDANYAHYDIVSVTAGYSVNTQDGSITPSSDQVYGTVVTGEWICGGGSYDTTLQVTIYDLAGHSSNSVSYTMSCS